MKLLKKSFFSLLLLCGLLLTFLLPVGLVQATVTNGNIGYYEVPISSVQNSSSTSESSDTSSTLESESSSTSESDTSTTDQSSSSSNEQTTDSTEPTVVPSQTTTSKPEGNFLKTNDTINYTLVIIGIVFTGIAVYNLKK